MIYLFFNIILYLAKNNSIEVINVVFNLENVSLKCINQKLANFFTEFFSESFSGSNYNYKLLKRNGLILWKGSSLDVRIVEKIENLQNFFIENFFRFVISCIKFLEICFYIIYLILRYVMLLMPVITGLYFYSLIFYFNYGLAIRKFLTESLRETLFYLILIGISFLTYNTFVDYFNYLINNISISYICWADEIITTPEYYKNTNLFFHSVHGSYKYYHTSQIKQYFLTYDFLFQYVFAWLERKADSDQDRLELLMQHKINKICYGFNFLDNIVSLFPEYKTPEYKAPEYKAPEYKTPEYKTPEYKTQHEGRVKLDLTLENLERNLFNHEFLNEDCLFNQKKLYSLFTEFITKNPVLNEKYRLFFESGYYQYVVSQPCLLEIPLPDNLATIYSNELFDQGAIDSLKKTAQIIRTGNYENRKYFFPILIESFEYLKINFRNHFIFDQLVRIIEYKNNTHVDSFENFVELSSKTEFSRKLLYKEKELFIKDYLNFLNTCSVWLNEYKQQSSVDYIKSSNFIVPRHKPLLELSLEPFNTNFPDVKGIKFKGLLKCIFQQTHNDYFHNIFEERCAILWKERPKIVIVIAREDEPYIKFLRAYSQELNKFPVDYPKHIKSISDKINFSQIYASAQYNEIDCTNIMQLRYVMYKTQINVLNSLIVEKEPYYHAPSMKRYNQSLVEYKIKLDFWLNYDVQHDRERYIKGLLSCFNDPKDQIFIKESLDHDILSLQIIDNAYQKLLKK